MQLLYEKFKGQVEFVTVVMDEDYNVYKEYLKENRECDWTFLFGGYAHLLKEEMAVFSIPHFILVNPDGKRANSYTKRPSEGIAIQLAKLTKR